MTFEEKIKRLEEIVKMLESGSVALDETVKLYEEGKKLAEELGKTLDEAEQKITVMTKSEEKQ